MATTWLSTNTELGLINALTQSLTVYLPNDAPQGKNLFVYLDLFDIITPLSTKIGDHLYVLLDAAQTNEIDSISFTAANCFVVTEPVV